MRVDFLDIPIDVLTLDETLEEAANAMRQSRRCQHVALNVAKFVKMRRNSELRRDVVESDIIGVDGMGIVWGARLLGIPVPQRVAGIDLFERLLEVCAREGFRPYLLGARQEVLEKAIARLQIGLPALRIAGAHHGYFSKGDEPRVVESIQRSGASCLFIALPTPSKERFLAEHRDRLGVPFIMGVGGSIDIVAGITKRAPKTVQAVGFEWLYRLAQEPQRMFWRYFSTNTAFAAILAKAWIAKHLRA
jgi:N-acetylglucosaminyldiphosphoundecaprenol N-acetyl-beta-D-mannosaminyltransferase